MSREATLSYDISVRDLDFKKEAGRTDKHYKKYYVIGKEGERAYVKVVEGYLSKKRADSLFKHYLDMDGYIQTQIGSGRYWTPRLMKHMSDPEIESHNYSGTVNTTSPWDKKTRQLRDEVSEDSEFSFNSGIVQIYRDGQDSISPHGDTEAGGDPTYIVVGISLGGQRKFVFKHNETGERIELMVCHGDAMIMFGEDIQRNWKHSIPKTKQFVHPRISVTFRNLSNTKE